MLSLSDDQVRRFRFRAQRLAVAESTAPAAPVSAAVPAVVQALLGVPAQEPTAPALAIRARQSGVTAAAVDAARTDQRRLVVTWCQRGTLQLVSAADLAWLRPLIAPGLIAAGRGRRAQLGLTEASAARGIWILRDVLADQGPLTRAEIAAELVGHDLPLAGQAVYHLLRLAALEGLICLGPDRGSEATFVLLVDWLPGVAPAPPANPPAELVRRYLQSYGPAEPADLAVWAGLPIGRARAAWRAAASDLVEVRTGGRPAWVLDRQLPALTDPVESAPIVRLVPPFDPYLLGYQNRDLAVAAAYTRLIHPGGGLINPAVVVDGRVVGRWRIQRRKTRQLTVELFETVSPAVQEGITAEIADLERFLDEPLDWTVTVPGG